MFVPILFRFSIVTFDGCPKLLFFPTPINAYLGFTFSKNSIVEPVTKVLLS